MNSEPSYLASLGELATLKNAIGFRGNQFLDGIEIEGRDSHQWAIRLRSGDLRADNTQHLAEQKDEQIAIHAFGVRSQTRAGQQFIYTGDPPQLLCLFRGNGGFGAGDPAGAMFARFAGVHGSISA